MKTVENNDHAPNYWNTGNYSKNPWTLIMDLTKVETIRIMTFLRLVRIMISGVKDYSYLIFSDDPQIHLI